METASLIFLVLLVEFIYDPIATLRNELLIKKSYGIFNSFSKQYIENKFLVYMSFVLFCILATIIIKAFLEGYIHWVLSFLFSFIILFYCLRHTEFIERINDFKFIIENKAKIEDETILKILTANMNVNKNFTNDINTITKNLFFSSTRNIFTVIFWFLLLGPGGALGYKILDYFSYTKDLRIDQKSRKNIKDISALIEFIPVRLSALAFAVVGNFEHSLAVWKKFNSEKNNMHKSNIDLINDVGASSAQLPLDYNKEDIIEKISYIQTLVARSLLAWLSIIMLLILGGFFN